MLVRSKPSAIAFLDRVRTYGKQNPDLSEQDCIRDMMNKNLNGEKEQTLMIPQRRINAFPAEIPCFDDEKPWEPGEFLIHFAGAWAHVKEEDPAGFLMRKYEGEIIWE